MFGVGNWKHGKLMIGGWNKTIMDGKNFKNY